MFRLVPAQAFADKLLCPFFEMKAHLFGEIAVDCTATEDTGSQFMRDSSLAQIAPRGLLKKGVVATGIE